MKILVLSLMLTLPFAPAALAETAVYVIHGTYDATSDWPRAIEGQATFGSELIRGTDWRLEPFLWRTSSKHQARVGAARMLARQIDGDRAERIVLVGHSHGGNVALEAVGRCRRKVDTVICLATPHIYLKVRGDKGSQLLPVYCSAGARQRIGKIYNIVCRGDTVVTLYADFRKGISEQAAIESTMAWRRRLNFPRLAADTGVMREVFEDFCCVEPISNLVVRPRLTVADHHVELASATSGIDAHFCIHSRRMGRLVGRLIADPNHALPYLKSLYIQADTDAGEPVDLATHLKWIQSRQSVFRFSGWLVKEIRLSSRQLKKPSGSKWDVDGSRPDLAYAIAVGDGSFCEVSRTRANAASVVWRPWRFLPRDQSIRFKLCDRDAFCCHDSLGTFKVKPQSGTFVKQSDQYRMQAVWVKAHY